MRTNIVSFIFLLVFLKNVASQPKIFAVDLINTLSDVDGHVKLNEALELIRNERHKLKKTVFRDLFDKIVKRLKFAKDDEVDSDESELDDDEQETFKEDSCRSLRPKDIRECLNYNLKKIKDVSDKIDMQEDLDKFNKIKAPGECIALDATVFEQLQCLEKFKIQPTDNKNIKYIESEEDEFVNVRDPEDCWNLKNTRMSKKLICLQLLHEKKGETNLDEFNNLKDPNDCLFLKKTTIHKKLECLEILEKKKLPEDTIKYDNFENIKDPNECLLLKKAKMDNKLKCLEKFEKKKDEKLDAKDMVIDERLENVTDPIDCVSLKTTLKNKYKCLDKFGKANDDENEGAILDDFDNLKEWNECLSIKETIPIKLKCLDKFQKLEEKATQKAKERTIPTADGNTLRTAHDNIIKGPEDCLFAYTSYGKKLKCIQQFENYKENFRSRSIESNHQFIATRPKRKIYSLYNYYNAVVKPTGFKDLTRQEFSQDYLDISELSRSIPKCMSPECNINLLKLSYKLKEKKPDLLNKTRRIFDSVHTRYIQAETDEDSDEIESPKPPKRKAQKMKNGVPIRFTVVSKEDRPNDSETEEHRSLKAEVNEETIEDEPDSEEEHQNLKKKKQLTKKKEEPPAEEIDTKSFMLFESGEDVNKEISAETEPATTVENNKKKEKKSHVNDDYSIETERPSSFKYSYLQGNNIVDYFRRRLEHFLPKRFHWEQEDFKNLGYHWYDGPRGRWSK